MLFVFIFIFGSNLRHSHVPIFIFFIYRKMVFISKTASNTSCKKHFNKNYGGYIAIWDRVFGTLCSFKRCKNYKIWT
jgi:sterol desaturase/sphingolipid hydroxylase (fatty acid hydroxylase superfamily)